MDELDKLCEEELEHASDHDLLIRVYTLLQVVYRGHNNHLAHHTKRELTYLTVTLGAIVTAIISITCTLIAFIK